MVYGVHRTYVGIIRRIVAVTRYKKDYIFANFIDPSLYCACSTVLRSVEKCSSHMEYGVQCWIFFVVGKCRPFDKEWDMTVSVYSVYTKYI